MTTTDINTIQSTIDYICSPSGYISLDKVDFDLTCAKPVMIIEKKGQNVEDIIKGVSDILADNTLTIPAKTLVHIESNILKMSDLQLIQEAFKAVSLGFIFLCPLLAAASCGLSLVAWHWIYLAVAMFVLALAYVIFKMKYYHLHEEYLASLKK